MKKTSPLDLNKLFPDYFNKNIFRGVIILMICLFVFTIYSNDWEYKFNYSYCPADSFSGCLLELESGDFITLAPDSYYGKLPNIHAQKFNSRSYSLIFFGFIINHLLYYFKTGNFKPKIDKKNVKKVKTFFNEVDKK